MKLGRGIDRVSGREGGGSDHTCEGNRVICDSFDFWRHLS